VRRLARARWALLLVLAVAACAPRPPKAPPPPQLTLTPAAWTDLPGWRDDRVAEAQPALARSCARLARLAPATPVGFAGTAADWQAPCARLAALAPGDEAGLRAVLESAFQPWLAGDNGRPDGLFTGYYEPFLRGSRTRHGPFQTPIYRRPADLITVDLGEFRPNLKGERIAGRVESGKLKPYADRHAIEGGALGGKQLEMVWVDDPIAAFFLHIQGSGRIALDDGTELRVGYEAQNGHPYVPIGKELMNRGALARDDVSLQSIRAWLVAHPAEAAAIMDVNPSYVFFRAVTGEGPLGGEGVPLTPGRSLAVDRGILPYGVPLWLDAEGPLQPQPRLQRLMVAQDTGGAIRGPVRGDVFWGHGAEAEERAGRMKSPGRYWLLLPRSISPQLPKPVS
jgi:membrane-bound lytic murein transglycosylase A